jgi:hypothetical protein
MEEITILRIPIKEKLKAWRNHDPLDIKKIHLRELRKIDELIDLLNKEIELLQEGAITISLLDKLLDIGWLPPGDDNKEYQVGDDDG